MILHLVHQNPLLHLHLGSVMSNNKKSFIKFYSIPERGYTIGAGENKIILQNLTTTRYMEKFQRHKFVFPNDGALKSIMAIRHLPCIYLACSTNTHLSIFCNISFKISVVFPQLLTQSCEPLSIILAHLLPSLPIFPTLCKHGKQ